MKQYYEEMSAEHIIGAVYKNPSILVLDERYKLYPDDFSSPIHRVIFTSIHNMAVEGATQVSSSSIENYLSSRPVYKTLYDKSNGNELLESLAEKSDHNLFDYYYNRLKKFSILRAFDNHGVDVSWIYNLNTSDPTSIQKQNELLDSSSIEEIVSRIDKKIEEIKLSYMGDLSTESVHAGEGVFELIERLKETPEVGIPLYGDLINSVTRGARLKKFYLISAPTGAGKSRQLLSHACSFSCGTIFKDSWVESGAKEPTLFITTELESEEIQTMALAFLSNVQEDVILNGNYSKEEEERVLKAGKILQESKLRIEHLPDFSLRDIESTIRKSVYENQTKYVCMDYIHTSLKILEEISQRTKGMNLREDNILFMLAIKLKDLCNELGIFIISATQVNGSWEERETSNQNVLRGAKAIADKIDFGTVSLPVSQTDVEALSELVSENKIPMPNLVHHIYKNRRGKYKSVKLWCKADLGTCRVEPLFLTDDNYKPINIENIQIKVKQPAERKSFA